MLKYRLEGSADPKLVNVTDEKWYSIGEVADAFGVAVSTLRYYDEIGLVPAPQRRARVRYYDRPALILLAYAQLFRLDGMLSIEQTSALLESTDHEHRNKLLERSREELADRIRRLQDAQDVLEHMMRCPSDRPLDCPVTGFLLHQRVEAALNGSNGRYGDTDGDNQPVAPTLARLARQVHEQIRNGGSDPEVRALLARFEAHDPATQDVIRQS
jgi:DNA-binding transcriptional MerR regulator